MLEMIRVTAVIYRAVSTGQPLAQTIYIILFNTQENPMRYELLYERSDRPKADSRKCGAEVKADRLEQSWLCSHCSLSAHMVGSVEA